MSSTITRNRRFCCSKMRESSLKSPSTPSPTAKNREAKSIPFPTRPPSRPPPARVITVPTTEPPCSMPLASFGTRSLTLSPRLSFSARLSSCKNASVSASSPRNHQHRKSITVSSSWPSAFLRWWRMRLTTLLLPEPHLPLSATAAPTGAFIVRKLLARACANGSNPYLSSSGVSIGLSLKNCVTLPPLSCPKRRSVTLGATPTAVRLLAQSNNLLKSLVTPAGFEPTTLRLGI